MNPQISPLRTGSHRTPPNRAARSLRGGAAFFGALLAISLGSTSCSGQSAGAQPPATAAGNNGSAVRAFVLANRTALQMDARQGYGGALASLAQVAGCLAPDKLSMSLRRSHGRLFRNGSSSPERLVDHLRTRPEFACRSVGRLSRLSSAGQWHPWEYSRSSWGAPVQHYPIGNHSPRDF